MHMTLNNGTEGSQNFRFEHLQWEFQWYKLGILEPKQSKMVSREYSSRSCRKESPSNCRELRMRIESATSHGVDELRRPKFNIDRIYDPAVTSPAYPPYSGRRPHPEWAS